MVLRWFGNAGLSQEDAQLWKNRRENKGELTNPSSLVKWPLGYSVCTSAPVQGACNSKC